MPIGENTMGRKLKYPDADQIIKSFYAAVSESYHHPAVDEKGRDGHKKQELIADEFGISRLKVRKILITTGDLVYPETAQIEGLLSDGKSVAEICSKLRMSKSTVNSLIPYIKGAYKLSDVSAAAERTTKYRQRKAAVQFLHSEPSSLNLWKAVAAFQGYPFTTSGRGSRKGVKFSYEVSAPGGAGGQHYDGVEVEGFGNELWIITASGEKREKSITRSSVDYALKITLGENVTGPKQLKIYGSSYVDSLVRRFGLISDSTGEK